MSLRWVLLLLLALNLAYLASGLYRAQLSSPDGQGASTQPESGIGEIRLIDSLADSPAPQVSGQARGVAEPDPGRAPGAVPADR